MGIPRYEVFDSGGRLVLARSRASTALDIGGLAVVFLLAIPGALWLLSAFGQRTFAPDNLWVVLMLLAAMGVSLYAFLVLVRAYRASRLREAVVFDRPGDRVTRGEDVLGAVTAIDRLELHRELRGSPDDQKNVFVLRLVVAGQPPDGAVELGRSTHLGEMARSAETIAAYTGARLVRTF